MSLTTSDPQTSPQAAGTKALLAGTVRRAATGVSLVSSASGGRAAPPKNDLDLAQAALAALDADDLCQRVNGGFLDIRHLERCRVQLVGCAHTAQNRHPGLFCNGGSAAAWR